MARGRPSLDCSWGGIRAFQLAVEPQEFPETLLEKHLVSLNLGPEAMSDACFEGQSWATHLTPHHGVGVFPAQLPYAMRSHHSREFLMLELAPDFVENVLDSAAPNCELRPVIGAQDPFAKHVLLALAEEARTCEPSGVLRAESLATALITHLATRVSPSSAHVAALASPKLRRVLDYISSRLDSPLALRTLAGVADMELFRFSRAFKQSTGLSPHRYVMEARINRAKELLRNREMSITDIALETGFATPSHFSVTFRRIANQTPRAYRDSQA